MMKAWEFLLQREGDRTWLPLETPTVEILEGRYRVVARTPRKDEEVDIYVSYVSTQDDPPKRRVQQRSRQTNAEGLVAFLPFTTLRTGRWELRCRPHVEPGSLEYQWPAVVQLQVLEQEAAQADDLFGWDLPGSEPVIEPVTDSAPQEATALTSAGAPQDGSVPEPNPDHSSNKSEDIQQLAERMSQMVVDSVLSAADTLPAATQQAEGETPEQESAEDVAISPPADPETPTSQPLVPVTATLVQETLTLGEDRTITLSGEIQAIAPKVALPSQILTVELRDPNTTEVWVNQQQEFPSTSEVSLKRAFEIPLTVPTSCTSQLLLGTATVWQRQEDNELQAMTSARFTAMAPVDALLSNVAATDESVASSTDSTIETMQQKAASNFVVSKLGMEPTTARANRQVNADLLELLKPGSGQPASPNAKSSYRPMRGRILPPKLASSAQQEDLAQASSPEGEAKRSLDLPNFGPKNPVFQWTPPEDLAEELAEAEDPSETVEQSTSDVPDMSDTDVSGVDVFDAGSVTRTADESTQPGITGLGLSGAENPFTFAPGGDFPGGDPSTPFVPAVGFSGSDASGSYEIPEGATLEELAELFGPPPALETTDTAPTESNVSDLGVGPGIASSGIASSGLSGPSILSEQPELTSEPLDSAEQAQETSEQITSTPAEIVLPAALASATFELAASNDLGESELGNAETDLEQSGPMETDESEDPFMNRLHELTVPQPIVDKPSPTLLAEVVVEDEDLPPTRLAWMQQSAPVGSSAEAISVDVPDLQVPDREFVVGETIRVSVRVAAEPSQLCARLWLLDCQTRTLLGEPQWVTAFLPFSENQVEATLEMKIPEGSMELQVEAIAVDPDSQRESRKVAVRRTVALPDNVDAAPEDNRFNPWMT